MTLKFPIKKTSEKLLDQQDKTNNNDEFSNAISLFISQRKKLSISLEELSNKTKISRNVLIAIENGWEKYLPEKTYLVAMIKKIEIELNLVKGSLNGILTKKVILINRQSKFKLNFINIDFLNSWIGSFLYFIIMLLSILVLNSQQKYLIKINSLSTEPIILNDKSIEVNKNINNQD